MRETQALCHLCYEKKVELKGTTIIKEGDVCDKVLIIIKGEVEMFKNNLNEVYFNHETSTIGVKEFNEKAALIRSDYIHNNNEIAMNLNGETTISSSC